MKHFLAASALFALLSMVPAAAGADSWRTVKMTFDAKGNRSTMVQHGGDGSVLFRAAFEYEKGPLSERSAQYLSY